MSTTFNIIGDIHGRDAWKRLVDLQCVNIFVGDFFDPYQAYPFETLERNFLEIIEYKKEHSQQVVLLYGNHDMEYLPNTNDLTNRYDARNAQRIQWLIENAQELFHGVAYAIGNQYLVTHAGVTNTWKNTYLPDVDDPSPANMAQAINTLWENDKLPFTFRPNHCGLDHNGDDPHHSPLWIRPFSLCIDNLYRGTTVKQIVGHSQVKEISEVEGIIMVDCLGKVEQSYKVSVETTE